MVPVLLLGRARALGLLGEEWLREVPAVAAELARRWGREPGDVLDGGTAAYVIEALPDAVLKLELPEAPGYDDRVAVLAAAGGDGYARLLEHDAEHRAFLLERLERFDVTDDDVIAALDAAWRVGVDADLLTGRDKAELLAESIEARWLALDRPCPRAQVERGLAACASRARAYDPSRAVVVHGDAQRSNLLRRLDGSHAFVDPEPFRCESAYDVAVAFRHRALPSGYDADVREWHTIERLSTALELMRIGAVDEGRSWLLGNDRPAVP